MGGGEERRLCWEADSEVSNSSGEEDFASSGQHGEQEVKMFRKSHSPRKLPSVRYSIKNTFLHVEDNDDNLVGFRDSFSDFRERLAPSLEIIPASVSQEKLKAYRLDYQKFRAGCAIGAKGELTSSVV